MSADVSILGIAQDFVTLFTGIPVLLVSLNGTCKRSIRSRFVLRGSLGYFFVAYLFYTAMAMNGEKVIPSIFIIPAVTLIAYFCTFLLIKNIHNFKSFDLNIEFSHQFILMF